MEVEEDGRNSDAEEADISSTEDEEEEDEEEEAAEASDSVAALADRSDNEILPQLLDSVAQAEG